MSPVLQHYFLVDDPYQKILNSLIEGIQQTPSWNQVQYSCFVMAGLIQLAFEAQGHRVKLLPCTGVAVYKQQPFKLGFPGLKQNNEELDGHVACIIDETILVDFGLGNVRRYGFPEFPIALAGDCKQSPVFPITLRVGNDIQFQWNTEVIHPYIEATVENHKPYAKALYQQYLDLKQGK